MCFDQHEDSEEQKRLELQRKKEAERNKLPKSTKKTQSQLQAA